MNYFDHNDTKGRDARVRAQIHNATRARMREPWDGTLFMSKRDTFTRRREGWATAVTAIMKARGSRRIRYA